MAMRITVLLLVALAAAACQLQALNQVPDEISLTPFPSAEAAAQATASPLVSADGEDLGILAGAPPTDVVAVTPTGNAPTRPAPSGRCTATPSGRFAVNIREQPGAQYALVGGLRYGDYADAFGRTGSGWIQVDIPGTGFGWVSSSVVTLNGPCNLQIVSETGGSVGNASTPVPSMAAPTPTSRYLSPWPGGYVFVTTAQVGSIAPNTEVGIGSAYYDGAGWVYQIGTRDGRYAEARDAQIAYAPGFTPGAATPPPAFSGEWGYSFVTTETVQGIPPGTRVAISTRMWDGYVWMYTITADGQTYVEARESQLAYAPGTNPVGPTPTSALLEAYRTGYVYVTTQQVGGIPANTPVSIGGAYFDGYGWLYQIVTRDNISAEARENQLRYVPESECIARANNSLGVVNIRSGPGANYPALNAFGGDITATAMGRTDNGWYQVRMVAFGNPFEGFVPAGEVALSGACDNLPVIPLANYRATPAVQELPTDVSPGDVVIPADMCTVIAVNNSASIYESNRADSTVVGELRPGPWLTVNARDGKGWYRVTLLNGGLGWVDGSQVQVNGPCGALPVL